MTQDDSARAGSTETAVSDLSVRRFWLATVLLTPVTGAILFLIAGTLAWPGAGGSPRIEPGARRTAYGGRLASHCSQGRSGERVEGSVEYRRRLDLVLGERFEHA